MAIDIIEIETFLENGLFSEDSFIKKTEQYDWGGFKDQKVLIRGCQSTIIPPWAYMVITGKLAGLAKSVRFGNEHDNVVVYRNRKVLEN